MSERRPTIGIIASKEEPVGPYAEALEAAGGEAVILDVAAPEATNAAFSSIEGLMLTGGADVDPALYGETPDPDANVRIRPQRDAVELPLIRAALDRDLPILAICRGMQALNVVMGGGLVQDLPGHKSPDPNVAVKHEVFIPPGARMTAILGFGGLMKVNSLHHQGINWAHKAPDVLVSAYSLKDGIIEAIESTHHRWVVGVQWHPERRDELPKVFQNLFLKFVLAAQEGLNPAKSPKSPQVSQIRSGKHSKHEKNSP